MAREARAGSFMRRDPEGRNWAFGAIVVGIIATALWLMTMLSRPSFVVLNHTVVLTQGIMAGVLLLGGVGWLIVEVFTGPGENVGHLVLRVIVGFGLGGLLGGLIANVFDWGANLLNPALSGQNYAAMAELAAVIFLGLVLIWNAAWAHSRRFARA